MFHGIGSCQYWSTKSLVARFKKTMVQADSAFGEASPITASVLHDLAIVVFQSPESREYEQELAEDLLQRTTVHVAVGTPQDRSQIMRAHAFATMLLGISALKNHQLDKCHQLFGDARQWLKAGRPFAQIHAEMLEADHEMLIAAFENGAELRDLDLNFLRPRCVDTEREETW